MKLLNTLLVTLIAGVALAQPEDPQLRREIQAVYTKWDRLVAKGDVQGLIAMIHPSFVLVDEQGKTMNYAQVREHFTQMAKSVRDARSKITVKHVKGNMDEAVAWVSMTISFNMKEGGRLTPTTFSARVAETLKRTPQGWRFVYSQELPREGGW